VVRNNTPSEGLQVGDYVRVPWGLDSLDGMVEDVYETSTGTRVVIRILDPDMSEQTETVALPAGAVEVVAEGDRSSVGTWVTGARYERSLAEALQRLLPTLSGEGNLEAKYWVEPRIDPYHRPDFLIRAGPRMLVIEAKTGSPEKNVTADAVRQLRAFLVNLSRDASGLLVTNTKLTPQALAILHDDPRLHAVQWRSARDDHRLAAAIASLLRVNEDQMEQD
jgi:hypothetical protein